MSMTLFDKFLIFVKMELCQNFVTKTETKPQELEKFLVVGIITSTEFQRARFIVEKLHTSFSSIYEKPEIRAMLDVEWQEYLRKVFFNI